MKTTQYKNNRELSANVPTSATALHAYFEHLNPKTGISNTVSNWKRANMACLYTDTEAERRAAELWLADHTGEIADFIDFGDYIEVYRKRK